MSSVGRATSPAEADIRSYEKDGEAVKALKQSIGMATDDERESTVRFRHEVACLFSFRRLKRSASDALQMINLAMRRI
jgi:hypothetical protein